MRNKEASENCKLLYEVKLHQEGMYQQEWREYTMLMTHILNSLQAHMFSLTIVSRHCGITYGFHFYTAHAQCFVFHTKILACTWGNLTSSQCKILIRSHAIFGNFPKPRASGLRQLCNTCLI